MKLLHDDYNLVYVWVDDNDENEELSPHFDYEADAFQWFEQMKKEVSKNE